MKLPKRTGRFDMVLLEWRHQCPAPPPLTPWQLSCASRGEKYWYVEVSLLTRKGDPFFPTQFVRHSCWKHSIQLCVAVRENWKHHEQTPLRGCGICICKQVCLSQAWVAKKCLFLHIFRIPTYLHSYKIDTCPLLLNKPVSVCYKIRRQGSLN